jgi:hypothetical protein
MAATGPTGPSGPSGLQGLRGLQGPPLGPTGPHFITSIARLNVITPSSSPVSLTYSTLGSYYNITSNVATDGNFVIALPTYTPVGSVETDNELFMAPEHVGRSWFIRNNFYYALTPTFTNGTVSFQGSTVSTIYIAYGQGVSITYNGSNGFIVI